MMHIREVTVYETSDAKRHETLVKAQEHIADLCREVLDGRLETLSGTRYTQSDKFAIVMALVPDFHSATELRNLLNKIMPDDFY